MLPWTKINKLEETDKFLEPVSWAWIMKIKEIWIDSVTSEETESLTKNLPTQKKPWTRWFHSWILPNNSRSIKLISIFLKPLQKTEEEGLLSSLLYKARITLTPKLYMATLENYRSILLVNIDALFLDKMLAN